MLNFLKFFLLSLLLSSSGYASVIEFNSDNTVVLRGEIDELSVAKAMSDVITHPKDELYLFITSPGGSVISGMRLVSLLRSTQKKVTCVTNMAASMAFVIMQACPKRLVTEDAVMMQHQMSYSLRGQEANNWNMANFLRTISRKVDEMQAKRIGMSYESFKAKVMSDWWLFDGEAVTAKVADGMTKANCSAELTRKTKKETVTYVFWSFEVTWSQCPLIDGPLEVKALNIAKGPALKVSEEYKTAMEKFNWRSTLFQKFNGDQSIKLPKAF